jgi:hypothetical protein
VIRRGSSPTYSGAIMVLSSSWGKFSVTTRSTIRRTEILATGWGGYYLNSARFRLVRVRQRLVELVPESRDSPKFKSLDELDANGTTDQKATEC